MRMNRGLMVLVSCCAFQLWASRVSAQAVPTSKLAWDQAAPDAATAQAYSYKYYPDGAVTGVVLSGVTCAGAVSPFTCQVAFPAFTPGAHTLSLTAGDLAGESLKSTALAFTFVVIPAVPANLRIQ